MPIKNKNKLTATQNIKIVLADLKKKRGKNRRNKKSQPIQPQQQLVPQANQLVPQYPFYKTYLPMFERQQPIQQPIQQPVVPPQPNGINLQQPHAMYNFDRPFVEGPQNGRFEQLQAQQAQQRAQGIPEFVGTPIQSNHTPVSPPPSLGLQSHSEYIESEPDNLGVNPDELDLDLPQEVAKRHKVLFSDEEYQPVLTRLNIDSGVFFRARNGERANMIYHALNMEKTRHNERPVPISYQTNLARMMKEAKDFLQL